MSDRSRTRGGKRRPDRRRLFRGLSAERSECELSRRTGRSFPFTKRSRAKPQRTVLDALGPGDPMGWNDEEATNSDFAKGFDGLVPLGTESIASGETQQSVSAMRFVPEGDAGQRTGCTGEPEDPIFCVPFRDRKSGQFTIVGTLPTLIATSLSGIGWRIARQSKSLIGVVSHP